MQRQSLRFLAAALAFGAAGATAQDGNLAGVTMRVLDDVSDVDTVILVLDANRGEGEESDAADRREAPAEDARSAEGEPAAQRRDAAAEVRRSERRSRDDDERSEGRLEDRDVERPAVPPSPLP
jgi:hypothetical protein